MFLHHAADCATIVKRLLLSRLQSRNLSMYMILDINENSRKPSNDGLRLFHLFRTGSAPGGSFRFPIRWSPLPAAVFHIAVTLSVDNAGEAHAAFLHMHVQPDPVAPDIAAGILINAAVLGAGAALVIKGAAARLHPQQAGPGGVQDHGFIAVLGGKGCDPHMIQQAVKAVSLDHFPGEVGIDVLGIVGGFQDQRLPVHVADTGEAIHRGSLLQVHPLADGPGGDHHAEIHQGGRRRLAQGGDLRGEGIAHAPAVVVGVGHKGALAPLADHQSLVLQLADGLASGVAADIQRPAQLRLRRQQVPDFQRAGGDLPLDDAHQLGVQGNVAAQGQLAVQDRIVFHKIRPTFSGTMLYRIHLGYSDCTIYIRKKIAPILQIYDINFMYFANHPPEVEGLSLPPACGSPRPPR